MIIRTLFAAGLMLAAAPAIAGDKPAGDRPAVGKSCVKHQVHTPAGKTVHNAPVYFCESKAETIAANEKLAPVPSTPATARD